MINRVGNVDRGAIMSEEFWHHFWQKTFSAESGERGLAITHVNFAPRFV